VKRHIVTSDSEHQTTLSFWVLLNDLTMLNGIQNLITCDSIFERFLEGVKVETETPFSKHLTDGSNVHL